VPARCTCTCARARARAHAHAHARASTTAHTSASARARARPRSGYATGAAAANNGAARRCGAAAPRRGAAAPGRHAAACGDAAAHRRRCTHASARARLWRGGLLNSLVGLICALDVELRLDIRVHGREGVNLALQPRKEPVLEGKPYRQANSKRKHADQCVVPRLVALGRAQRGDRRLLGALDRLVRTAQKKKTLIAASCRSTADQLKRFRALRVCVHSSCTCGGKRVTELSRQHSL